MLLQGMKGGWVVIEASHTVRSGLNVTCHMLSGYIFYNAIIYGTAQFKRYIHVWVHVCTHILRE